LDTLVKMLDDYPLWQAVIPCWYEYDVGSCRHEASFEELGDSLLGKSIFPPISSKIRLTGRHPQCLNHSAKRFFNNGVHPQPIPDPDS
jgi:hypothetical protein